MTLGLHLVMIGGGALCVLAALCMQNRLHLAASSFMLAAMIDAHFTGMVPLLYWVIGLILVGLMLGFRLRRELRPVTNPGGASSRTLHDRPIAVASALSYPVMAWLLLQHTPGQRPEGGRASSHSDHGISSSMLPLALAVLLVLTLAVLTLLAAHRRSKATGESAGMTVMLAAMLIPA